MDFKIKKCTKKKRGNTVCGKYLKLCVFRKFFNVYAIFYRKFNYYCSMNRLAILLTSSIGVASLEVAEQITLPTAVDVQEVVKLVIQIAIGIATIINLFRKKENKVEATENGEIRRIFPKKKKGVNSEDAPL